MSNPARQIQETGVSEALDALAGPFGLRRFVVHFELVGAQVRVSGLDAVPLRIGGGPPPADLNGERMAALEQALGRLQRSMEAWRMGAIGYVRDARGKTRLLPVFGEEARNARVDTLPMPGPPAHPLETHEYLHLRESLVAPCRQVHSRSQAMGQDWEDWEIKADTQLILHLELDASGEPTRTRQHSCQVLGTFDPTWMRFTWRVEEPLFREGVFDLGDFSSTWDAAMELGLLCTARLEAQWLFVQPIDDRGSVLLVSVFR
jgi:hypothetical protein